MIEGVLYMVCRLVFKQFCPIKLITNIKSKYNEII